MKAFCALIAVLPLVIDALSPRLNKRSITCLEAGATATATWTNSDGQTCSFTGVVGSNFGTNSDGSEYVLHELLIVQYTLANNSAKLFMQRPVRRWMFRNRDWRCVHAGLLLA